MQRLDVHVAFEACDIVIESATMVAILESGFKTAKRPHHQRHIRPPLESSAQSAPT
jgi:hypothetical protein